MYSLMGGTRLPSSSARLLKPMICGLDYMRERTRLHEGRGDKALDCMRERARMHEHEGRSGKAAEADDVCVRLHEGGSART